MMSRTYCVRVLASLSAILILFPLFPTKSSRCGLVFQILAWFLIIFILITGPLSIVIKDTIFSNIPTSSRVVYDLSFAFLYISNLHISFINIFKEKEISVLFAEFLDTISRSCDFVKYFVVFLCIFTLNTTLIIFTQLRRTDNAFYYLSVFLVEGFLSCRVITTLFIIFLGMIHISEDFKRFNNKLVESQTGSPNLNFRFLHNNLSDRIETVNSLFGLVLLLTIFYIITTFLRHAAFITLNYTDTSILIVRSLWIFSYGFQATYLAHVGEQLSSETKRTVSICYRLMQKIPLNEVTGSTHKQLYLLSQQAYNRRVIISAAGFFNVDHSMILFIATTFCTYFIVVMQLLSKYS